MGHFTTRLPHGPHQNPRYCPVPWLLWPFYSQSLNIIEAYPETTHFIPEEGRIMFLSVSAYKSTLCQSKEYQNLNNRHSEILKALVPKLITSQITVSSVVKLCSVVDVIWSFRLICYLHVKDRSQKGTSKCWKTLPEYTASHHRGGQQSS
jgi:hypothetical protein